MPARSTRRASKPVALPSSSTAGPGEGEGQRVVEFRKLAHRAGDDRFHISFGTFAFVPFLELDKREHLILAGAAEAEAEHTEHAFDVFLFIDEEVMLDFFQHLDCLFARRAGRELGHGKEHALILLGKETGGLVDEEKHDHTNDDRVENEREMGVLRERANTVFVAIRAALESPVDPLKKAIGTKAAQSTRPKSVSVLIENPATAITPKVPSITMGTAIVRMSVARQFCRKR